MRVRAGDLVRDHRVRGPVADERGVVAIIVAILLVVLFGFAAFALDTGNAWQARRHLITATDAAALAAARDYALGRDGCGGTDDALVSANYPGSAVTVCAPSSTGFGPGYVTVGAKHDVDWNFARVFGLAGGTIRSSTTASWGSPLGLTGLRPLGLCADVPELAAWLASNPRSPSGVIRIPYTKASPDQCGGDSVPGNWGVQDFDGGANSNNDTRTWLRDGYPELVYKNSWVPGDTGAFSNSLGSELDRLVTSGETFTLPVFDTATGNGANATFFISDFVGVTLVGYKATGKESERYIDLRFNLVVAQGECCDRGSFTGVSVVRVCSVDHAVLDPSHC